MIYEKHHAELASNKAQFLLLLRAVENAPKELRLYLSKTPNADAEKVKADSAQRVSEYKAEMFSLLEDSEEFRERLTEEIEDVYQEQDFIRSEFEGKKFTIVESRKQIEEFELAVKNLAGENDIIKELTGEVMGDWGFSDEYSTCDGCYTVLRISPDSYSWTPEFVTYNCERYCFECADEEDILEEYKNANKALPSPFQNSLEEIDIDFENGWHYGQNADPSAIIKLLNEKNIDVWFDVSPSQFYVSFKALVKPEDLKLATKILEGGETDLPYDQATELGKALNGGGSEHITVTKRTLTPEEFISGDWK